MAVPKAKDLAVAPRHAPVPPTALKKPTYVEDKDSANSRPHHIDLKTHVSRPPGAQGQDRSLIFAVRNCRAPASSRRAIFLPQRRPNVRGTV